MRIPFVVLAAAALAAAGLPAGAQLLKPGLWEISNKMKGSAEIDAAMAKMEQHLAAMPPEQRKQMEAMMAQRGMRVAPAAGGGMTMQVCMTKEMAERNDVPMQEGCTMTKQQRSGNTMKVAYNCARPPSSGEGEFTFLGPEAYKSHMVVNTTAKGKPETLQMDGAGKWLGTDCGSVKPVAVPKK